MKLKKYSNFQINESFTTSSEYYDFINKNKIEKEFFFDSLLEVTDIPKVKTHYYTTIIDSKDKIVNDTILDNEEYRMHYVVMIEYWFMIADNYDFNIFSKQLENLNTIRDSINEMIDRVSSSVKLDKNTVVSTSKLTFMVGFTKEIDSDELKKAFKSWNAYTDEEYKDGIANLRAIYLNAGRYIRGAESIDLDKFIDTSDDGNNILIGFFANDEDLYVIATFNKETKKFNIDKAEVIESIKVQSGLNVELN